MTAPPARDPDLAGAEAALLRARRGAVERRFRAAPARKRDRPLDDALVRSKEHLVWVADRLNGLEIPALPHDRRVQLAAGSQHLAIRHGQAIVALIDRAFYGSARALLRPMLEAYVRGRWLRDAATDIQIEAAIKDRFPHLQSMIDGLPLDALTKEWWPPLHGYAHGGARQIGAGPGPGGGCEDATTALRRSDATQLAAASELALAADNRPLARALLDHMRHIGPPPGSVTAP